MKLYNNNKRQDAQNSKYPYETEIKTIEDLRKVVVYDHVSAKFKDDYRKNDNFICSDCNMFDVDNMHSDNADEWITPAKVKEAFPNVAFYVVYSRNHMKVKDNKKARPKFHIYFQDVLFEDMMKCKLHKEKVCAYFPYFDNNAKDVARFFFGVENPQIEYHEGKQLLYEFMETVNLQTPNTVKQNTTIDVIPQGQRHNYMLSYACRILTRHGDNKKTYDNFQKESLKCSPLLEEKELNSIWCDAKEYYHTQIRTTPDYVDPSQYGENEYHNATYKPSDFTDVGLAQVFSEVYKHKVGYSEATKFLVYNGTIWEESDLRAQALAQKLTKNQLTEAWEMLEKAYQIENSAMVSGNKEDEEKAKKSVENAESIFDVLSVFYSLFSIYFA